MLKKYKVQFVLLLFLLIASCAADAQAAPTEWKFDFGNGKPAAGYIKVTPGTAFNYQLGYGFDHGSVVTAVDRGGKDPLTGDFITSDKPFFFSIKLPEGNYDIKIILGDK